MSLFCCLAGRPAELAEPGLALGAGESAGRARPDALLHPLHRVQGEGARADRGGRYYRRTPARAANRQQLP